MRKIDIAILVACFLAIGYQPAKAVETDYVGFTVSNAYQILPESAYYNPGGRDMRAYNHSAQPKVYAGKQSGAWIAEVGFGGLSRYQAINQGPVPGRGTGCCYIKQRIETYQVYGAGGLSLPVVERLSVFGMVGYAFVWGKNVEQGQNENGPDQYHTNRTRDFAPVFLAGVKYAMTDTITLRLEYSAINDVAQSHWTLSSDVRSYGIGVEVKLNNN